MGCLILEKAIDKYLCVTSIASVLSKNIDDLFFLFLILWENVASRQ